MTFSKLTADSSTSASDSASTNTLISNSDGTFAGLHPDTPDASPNAEEAGGLALAPTAGSRGETLCIRHSQPFETGGGEPSADSVSASWRRFAVVVYASYRAEDDS
jgi:hypothetical protein